MNKGMIGGLSGGGILGTIPSRIEEDSYEDQASIASKNLGAPSDFAQTQGKHSASSKGKLESLGGSAGVPNRPVQVTVTLEERLKKHLPQTESGSNSERSKAITPQMMEAGGKEGVQMQGNIMNKTLTSLFRKTDQTILGGATSSSNLTSRNNVVVLGGGRERNENDLGKKVANIRSLSQKFLQEDGAEDYGESLPQLSARIPDKTLDSLQDLNPKLSKTLYKQDIKQLKYHNPFKREEKLEIPTAGGEQRSLSSLGFIVGNKTQRVVTLKEDPNNISDPQARFKNYLPHIIKQKLNSLTTTVNPNQVINDQKRFKVVVKKDNNMEHTQQLIRQDISYLGDLQTPSQKPSILTTGDRGQDDLLEATLAYKNLGKSLINLPNSLKDLYSMLKAFNKSQLDQNRSSIFNLIPSQDEEEMIMERYLKENFDPVEALEEMLRGGYSKEEEREVLINTQLPSTRLKQYIQANKTSPKRLYLNKTLEGKDMQKGSPQKVDPEQLQNYPPIIDTKPDNLTLINSRLMKKYGEEAFLNSQVGKKETPQLTIKKTDLMNQNMTLFGEQAQKQRSGTPTKYSLPQDLGNPSSRQDAIILLNWYEKMLQSIYDTRRQDKIQDEKLFPLIQLFMNITMKELVRQVSVHCHERGQLLTRVFSCYIKFLEMHNADHSKKRKDLKHDYALKLDRYVTILEHQSQSYRDQIAHLEHREQQLKAEVEDLQKLHKDQSALAQKFKKKCLIQQRDQEQMMTRTRYLEKENKQMKLKLQEIRDDFPGLEVTDLDDNDRLRLMIEVEREIADIERQNKINQQQQQQRSQFGTSKTSNMAMEEDLLQVNDKDLIGTDERSVGTGEEFDQYIKKTFGKKMREKEAQTDPRQGISDAQTYCDAHDIGFMVDQGLDAVYQERTEQKGKQPRQRTLSVIDEEDRESIKNLEDNEMSDDSNDSDSMIDLNGPDQDNKKKFNSADTTPLKGLFKQTLGPHSQGGTSPELSYHRQDQSPMQDKTSLIEYLALMLVKRANQVLEREKDRIDRLQDTIPAPIADKLKQSLQETTQDVEGIKADIKKKHKEVRRSLKQYMKAEKNLRQANLKLDSLEMDNYNLRENFSEQMKVLEDYKSMVSDLHVLVETMNERPSKEVASKIKDLVSQLKDMIHQNHQRALQLTEDTDNVLSNLLSVQPPNGLVLQEDQHQAVVTHSHYTPIAASNNNAQTRSSKSNNDPQKKAFKFKQFDLGRKRVSQGKLKGTHPAYVLLRKVLGKDPNKLKDVMPRKMLLRVIYQVYNERGLFENISENTMGQLIQNNQSVGSQMTSQNATQSGFATGGIISAQAAQNQSSLIEWVYDNFLQKYGLKNVADRKFIQLLSSCITYRDQLHRINLFGRFMEIFDDLPMTDYNRYLKLSSMFQQQILNFKFDDDIDSTLLPMSRALDYFKFKFDSKLIPHIFHNRLYLMDRVKVNVTGEELRQQKHLKGVRDAVDFDWFVQFVIDTYIYLQDDRDQQIQELFLAVDVANTGMMNQTEFEMITKLCYLKSSKYIQRLFEEYSQPLDPLLQSSPKMLSTEQFYNLCIERELFTPRVLHSVIKSKNPEKDFETLFSQLPSVISLFRARLVTMDLIENRDLLDLLDNLRTCVQYSTSPRISWLCFRIVDDHLKRLYLKHHSEQLMPIELGQIQELKLKPSHALINNLPINYFETQH